MTASPQTAAPLVPSNVVNANSISQDEQSKPDLLPGGFHRFRPVADADDFPNEETNRSRPLTDSVITIRIIKSFAYRSMKALVLQHVDITTMTVDQLRFHCQQEVRSNSTFKAFKSFADKLDTLKIYTRAHGAKTTNLIINLDHPDWILEDGTKTLVELGLENEAELSLFNRADYEDFIQNPETKCAGFFDSLIADLTQHSREHPQKMASASVVFSLAILILFCFLILFSL